MSLDSVTPGDPTSDVLTRLLDVMPVGTALLDPHLRYVYVNERLVGLFGRAPNELLGQPVERAAPELAATLGPHLQAVLTTGTSVVGVDMRGQLASGAAFQWQTSFFPLLGPAGQIQGVLAVVVDQAARAAAERRSAAFTSLGHTLSSVVTAEAAGRVIVAAADELIGWDACSLDLYASDADLVRSVLTIDLVDGQRRDVAAAYTDLPPSAMARHVIEYGAQLILREPPSAADDLLVPFGDTGRPSLSLMFVPIRSGTTNIGVLSIQSYRLNAYTADDLQTLQALADHCSGALERIRAEEERQRLERKLLEMQKLQSIEMLAGGIAHDFNNLLTAIVGNVDIALLDLPHLHPAREPLASVMTAARRAADLTRQLLAYAGKGRFAVERVNLNALVGEMADLLGAAIDKNISVQYQFEPRLPLVEVDPTQIRQVVMNLIVNAAEAIGPAPGSITLTTYAQATDRATLEQLGHSPELRPDVYVFLEVADTGVGMDLATQARIFEPFFTTKFTGRGLGLAAALGIMRGHNGALDVSSAPGRGTTFTLMLPASDGQTTAPPLEAGRLGWRASGTALVVDDEPGVCAMAAQALERHGFAVLTASNGEQGVELFRAHADRIGLVLLDLVMPRLSGDQAYRLLREARADLPIVVMSGYSEQEFKRRFEGLAPVHFLRKPFTLLELRRIVQQAIAAPSLPRDD